MSADKVVETIGSTAKLKKKKIQAVLALDASRGLMDPHKQSEVQEVHV